MGASFALWAAIILTAMTIGLAAIISGPIADRLELNAARYKIYLAVHAALSAGAWFLWFFV